MSHAYVVQGCPICGRRLQVKTYYIGRRVQCTHCGGSFRSRLDGKNVADDEVAAEARDQDRRAVFEDGEFSILRR